MARMDEAERKRWTDYQNSNNDLTLRNAIIEQYLPLVNLCAYRALRTLSQGVLFNDLKQWGCLGLLQAVENFDLTFKVSFEIYATLRIRGAIIDGLRQVDPIGRNPRKALQVLNRKRGAIENQFGRSISDHELSVASGVSESQITSLYEIDGTISLSCVTLDSEGTARSRFLSDEIPDKKSPEVTERSRKFEFIKRVCRSLTIRERLIVLLYYFEQMSMGQVGAALGLSESAISLIHKSIVRHLRETVELSELIELTAA